MLQGQLGPYTRAAGLYHCPADTSVGVGQSLPRVRGLSMNYVGGDKSPTGGHSSKWDDTWPNFFKTGDFRKPVMTWLFVDEHPDAVNDGYMLMPIGDGITNVWGDLPASYHSGASGFSFADGHSEIHKWLEPSTRKPIIKIDEGGIPFTPPANETRDLAWAFQRISPQ